MTITIVKEVDFDDIVRNAWCGACDTLATIEEHGKEDEFMYICQELFPEGIGETELNDFLWFDDEQIFEWLGISEEDEEEE